LIIGFECEILGWDVSGLSIAPIFKLSEHTSPVVALQCISGLEQAVSVDEEGWFKWWNLKNLVAMEDSDRCLQTFRFGDEKYPWKANSFTILNNGYTILAAGTRVKLIERVRLKPRTIASNTALYNDVSFTILTTTDKEIQVWDAVTGSLIRSFRNISSTEITGVEFDARQRKFIVANQVSLVCDFCVIYWSCNSLNE